MPAQITPNYETFADAIKAWPDDTLAADLGVQPSKVAVWKHRDTLPPEYWPDAVKGAAARGIEGITVELLAALAAKKKRRSAA